MDAYGAVAQPSRRLRAQGASDARHHRRFRPHRARKPRGHAAQQIVRTPYGEPSGPAHLRAHRRGRGGVPRAPRLRPHARAARDQLPGQPLGAARKRASRASSRCAPWAASRPGLGGRHARDARPDHRLHLGAQVDLLRGRRAARRRTSTSRIPTARRRGACSSTRRRDAGVAVVAARHLRRGAGAAPGDEGRDRPPRARRRRPRGHDRHAGGGARARARASRTRPSRWWRTPPPGAGRARRRSRSRRSRRS